MPQRTNDSGRIFRSAETIHKRASRNSELSRHATAQRFPQADFWPASSLA